MEQVVEALRERGFRLSAARRIVLEALFAADGPVSAEYIARGLEGKLTSSDLASVYRNLEWMESLGVVQHVHLGHGPGLYTLARDGQREYLVCERCGRVESVDPSQLDGVRAQIRDFFGFEVRFSHFAIPGLCLRCVEAVEAEEPGGGEPEHAREHSHGHHVHSHPHAHGREHGH
jgi:Fur family transcriptional regulator, ferric uptake regulator